jgi:hypothetical protein
MTSPIPAGGLILDIGGALFLASSFILKKPTDIAYEAMSVVGWNSRLLISAAKQKAEAQIGAVLLVAGFLAQLTSYVDWHPSWARLCWTLPAAVGADGLALLFALYWRKSTVLDAAMAFLEAYWEIEHRGAVATTEEPDPQRRGTSAWLENVAVWARSLGHDVVADGDYAAIGLKALGARRWKALTADKSIPADLLAEAPPERLLTSG